MVKFIERIVPINRTLIPATITLNFERLCNWVNVGAQPTDNRSRTILRNEGVLLMKHHPGLDVSAMAPSTMPRPSACFEAWKANKQKSIAARQNSRMADTREQAAKARFDRRIANEQGPSRRGSQKEAENRSRQGPPKRSCQEQLKEAAAESRLPGNEEAPPLKPTEPTSITKLS